jgi:hypothetical protein
MQAAVAASMGSGLSAVRSCAPAAVVGVLAVRRIRCCHQLAADLLLLLLLLLDLAVASTLGQVMVVVVAVHLLGV